MRLALTSFLLALSPLAAHAQSRWLGSQKENAFRDFVQLVEWQWVLPTIAGLALFAFIAKRRWWHGFFVWTPGIVAVLLAMLLGTGTLVGHFFDRVDAERAPKPAVTKTR